jgi:hypothetical protein
MKKHRDGQCSRDKVRERRHFEQDQWPAPIRQATLLIELVLDGDGIFSHHLRTPSRIQRRQIGSVTMAREELRRTLVIKPRTLQNVEMFTRFIHGLSKEFGLRDARLRHP